MKTTTTAAAPLLLASLLAVLSPDSALTQQISVGARGGYSSTTIGWDGAQDIETDWNSNFHIGGLVRLDLHESFAVQLEAWYARKGSGARYPGAGSAGDFKLTYLQIPLLAQLMAPLSADARVSPHLFAGPSISFELSCKISGTITGIRVNDDCDAPDLGLERKSTDIGLIFGGGIEIQAGPGTVLVDGMYDLGLKNLNDDPEAPDDSVKGRAWMLSIGYLLLVARW